VDDFDTYAYLFDPGITRCKLWGELKNSTSEFRSAKEECCICGGGSLHDTYCRDVTIDGKPWLDATEQSCAFYATQNSTIGDDYYYDDSDTLCYLYGGAYTQHGYTAGTACCACGGGVYGNTCTDLPDFIDAHNRTCSYYADDPVYDTTDDLFSIDSRCRLEGHRFGNADIGGLTADEACCVCGGGVHDYEDVIIQPVVDIEDEENDTIEEEENGDAGSEQSSSGVRGVLMDASLNHRMVYLMAIMWSCALVCFL